MPIELKWQDSLSSFFRPEFRLWHFANNTIVNVLSTAAYLLMSENFIASSTSFMNVVIIEDEVELGQLIQIFLKKRILARSPGEVRTATSIEDGIKYIDELHPDWIFLDNNLPDGRGIDLLDKIKGSEFAPKVVMMSAMTNIRQEALRHGADYFMDKPISFAEIKRIMGETGVSSETYN